VPQGFAIRRQTADAVTIYTFPECKNGALRGRAFFNFEQNKAPRQNGRVGALRVAQKKLLIAITTAVRLAST
jgi:hypothetical protein